MKFISNIELAKKIDLIIVENLRKSEYDHDGSLDRFLKNLKREKLLAYQLMTLFARQSLDNRTLSIQ